jgi:hypothetical protein
MVKSHQTLHSTFPVLTHFLGKCSEVWATGKATDWQRIEEDAHSTNRLYSHPRRRDLEQMAVNIAMFWIDVHWVCFEK